MKGRQRIEESEDRFRTLAATIPQLIWTAKPDGSVDYLSEQWADYIGLPPERLYDWGWEQVVHPDDLPNTLRAWRHSVQTGEPLEIKHRFRYRASEWRWQLVRGLPIRDGVGSVTKWAGTCTDIEDQIRIEDALRESQERRQLAMESAGLAAWEFDIETGEVAASGLAQSFLGTASGEASFDYWFSRLHADDRVRVETEFQAAATGERPYNTEFRIHRDDGIGWIRSRARMVEGTAGRKRLIGVAEDITDRKGAEVALRQSEERFRQMAESMPQVVWTAMPDGTCDYVNARWTDLTGCDLAATQAGAFRRNMLPEDLDSMDLAAIAGLRAGEPYAFECRFQRISDGTLRWHLVRAVPVRNADGEVTKWLGTSTDIDDRKQAAEALQLSDWRLRFTLDAANFGSWELNLQTQHAHRSPRHDAIFGYESPLPDWTYAQFLEHVIPEDREEVNRRFQNSFNGGGDWNFECRIKRASDRTTRWIWGYGKTIVNDEGTPTLMLGLVSDITARKEAESALAQANEDLKRANADLEQFAYSASHDLQEPLRSVIIYGQLLSRRYKEKLDGQALEFLGYLTGGASRMEMLVRDLLAYTQVKHLEAPEIQCDATQSLSAALSNLTNAIVESEARITAGPLPVLSVHNIHLQQLFQNLIGNALKYTSKIQPSIEVGAERQNEHWLFSVRDNGIGIDPQYKERIFGLFKRLHAGDEYSGTGIGLAICKRIVDRYHGRIWVESEPGKGSAFYFTLPI